MVDTRPRRQEGILLALLLLATGPFAIGPATAAQDAGPALEDPAGDAELDPAPLGLALRASEIDLARIEVEAEDAQGLHVVVRFHDRAEDALVASAYSVSLLMGETSLAAGWDEDGPTGSASDASWSDGALELVVPHGALPATERGARVLLTGAAASSAGAYGASDETPPGAVAVYRLGAKDDGSAPLADPPAAPAEAGATPPSASERPHFTHGINVVSSANAGCSDDRDTPPDLRVNVHVDGFLVLQAYGEQRAAPLYAVLHGLNVSKPVHVRVSVEEAEGGGWFEPDVFHACDIEPGSGYDLAFTWDGSARTIDTHGKDALSARVRLVLGPEPPQAPVVAVEAGERHVVLAWQGAATEHALAAGANEGIVHRSAGAGNVLRLDDLCDARDFGLLRVVRVQGDWMVGSEPVRVATSDAPPRAPVITAIEAQGDERHVRLEAPDAHDARMYEVAGHDGAAKAWVHTNVTPRSAVYDALVRLPADRNITSYQVRQWDASGPGAWSEPFRVGERALAPMLSGQVACPLEGTPALGARAAAEADERGRGLEAGDGPGNQDAAGSPALWLLLVLAVGAPLLAAVVWLAARGR